MIIKPLLTVILVGILFVALLQKNAGRLLKLGVVGSVGVGILITWFPDSANRIASVVGVGRGADLIFYLWILISVLVFLLLYVKLVSLSQALTRLARHVALREVVRPLDDRHRGDD